MERQGGKREAGQKGGKKKTTVASGLPGKWSSDPCGGSFTPSEGRTAVLRKEYISESGSGLRLQPSGLGCLLGGP